jgi:hypothetical protein
MTAEVSLASVVAENTRKVLATLAADAEVEILIIAGGTPKIKFLLESELASEPRAKVVQMLYDEVTPVIARGRTRTAVITLAAPISQIQSSEIPSSLKVSLQTAANVLGVDPSQLFY